MYVQQYKTTSTIWRKGVEIPVGSTLALSETEAKYILFCLTPIGSGPPDTPDPGTGGDGTAGGTSPIPVPASLASSFNASTRTFSGKVTADPANLTNVTVALFLDGATTARATGTVNPTDGTWSIPVSDLPGGDHSVRIEAIVKISNMLSASVAQTTLQVSAKWFAFGLLGAGS